MPVRSVLLPAWKLLRAACQVSAFITKAHGANLHY